MQSNHEPGELTSGRRVRIAEAWRRSVRHGDDFDRLGGHFSNQEAPEVSSWGSWLLCTPSLVQLDRSSAKNWRYRCLMFNDLLR